MRQIFLFVFLSFYSFPYQLFAQHHEMELFFEYSDSLLYKADRKKAKEIIVYSFIVSKGHVNRDTIRYIIINDSIFRVNNAYDEAYGVINKKKIFDYPYNDPYSSRGPTAPPDDMSVDSLGYNFRFVDRNSYTHYKGEKYNIHDRIIEILEGSKNDSSKINHFTNHYYNYDSDTVYKELRYLQNDTATTLEHFIFLVRTHSSKRKEVYSWISSDKNNLPVSFGKTIFYYNSTHLFIKLKTLYYSDSKLIGFKKIHQKELFKFRYIWRENE